MLISLVLTTIDGAGGAFAKARCFVAGIFPQAGVQAIGNAAQSTVDFSSGFRALPQVDLSPRARSSSSPSPSPRGAVRPHRLPGLRVRSVQPDPARREGGEERVRAALGVEDVALPVGALTRLLRRRGDGVRAHHPEEGEAAPAHPRRGDPTGAPTNFAEPEPEPEPVAGTEPEPEPAAVALELAGRAARRLRPCAPAPPVLAIPYAPPRSSSGLARDCECVVKAARGQAATRRRP